jgi:hypothetical protein
MQRVRHHHHHHDNDITQVQRQDQHFAFGAMRAVVGGRPVRLFLRVVCEHVQRLRHYHFLPFFLGLASFKATQNKI